jgi:hypothetical protein
MSASWHPVKDFAMRLNRFSTIVALCAVTSGCSPIINGIRTLIIEPFQYCNSFDTVEELARDRKLADAAWKRIICADGRRAYSDDYAKGFRRGYVDYLYAGGNGLPPPVPPREYWRVGYETPEGHQAIEDWFAGFRHGASVAMESGYRQFVVVPASAPYTPPVPPPIYSGAALQPIATPALQPPVDVPLPEAPAPVLPPPRKIPEPVPMPAPVLPPATKPSDPVLPPVTKPSEATPAPAPVRPAALKSPADGAAPSPEVLHFFKPANG